VIAKSAILPPGLRTSKADAPLFAMNVDETIHPAALSMPSRYRIVMLPTALTKPVNRLYFSTLYEERGDVVD